MIVKVFVVHKKRNQSDPGEFKGRKFKKHFASWGNAAFLAS